MRTRWTLAVIMAEFSVARHAARPRCEPTWRDGYCLPEAACWAVDGHLFTVAHAGGLVGASPVESNSPIFDVLLPAVPAAVSHVRAHLRVWLQQQQWPAEPGDDIEYAVSEAVSNAVEHAYPPGVNTATVAVVAELEALPGGMRRLRVRVSDHGRWRPIPHHPDGRRMGIRMMGMLMDHVDITEGDGVNAGTDIMLLSPPVPAGR